ncbi:MAG: hypothetical protein U5Q44_06750 [Dehalococcoidia bacterium]|nr:hypothetical protein [Dehalococcoidia bacterium]
MFMKMRMFSTSWVERAMILAGVRAVVVAVAQPLEVVVDVVAERVGDALAHGFGQVLLDERGNADVQRRRR